MALSRHFDDPQRARSGNRDRIVEASLALFNDEGVRRVTTNHIAAHLSISPGNLYYHFRNKEEIIRALFPRVVDAARASLALPEDRKITPDNVGTYHLLGAQSLWAYRFFFRDRAELLASDPVLSREYRVLHAWLTDQFVALFRHLCDQGHMDLRGFEGDTERIATNAIILWMSWLSFVTTARPRATISRRDIAEGALRSFLTFAPLLDQRFVRAVRAAIDSWPAGGGEARSRPVDRPRRLIRPAS